MCFQAHQTVYKDGFVDEIRPSPVPSLDYNLEPPMSTPNFQRDRSSPVPFPSSPPFPSSLFQPDNDTYVGNNTNNETTTSEINLTYPPYTG